MPFMLSAAFLMRVGAPISPLLMDFTPGRSQPLPRRRRRRRDDPRGMFHCAVLVGRYAVVRWLFGIWWCGGWETWDGIVAFGGEGDF